MTEIRDALLRMVRSYKSIGEILNAYVKVGLDSNSLYTTQGEIAEAIYQLIGEHVEEFEDSTTYVVLNAPCLTDERRCEMLFVAWKANHCQPRPNIMKNGEIKDLYEKNGGYMSPEGDWS